LREVAGTGSEQIQFPTRNQQIGSDCCSDFSAKPGDRLDVLARAVLLVADMAIPDHDRAAVLVRVVAAMSTTRNDF
jgi:hypothetical protein